MRFLSAGDQLSMYCGNAIASNLLHLLLSALMESLAQAKSWRVRVQWFVAIPKLV